METHTHNQIAKKKNLNDKIVSRGIVISDFKL